MANRLRRTYQPPRTPLPVGPHPPRRAVRRPHLVRIRGHGPQPLQAEPGRRTTRPQPPTNSLLQVEVTNQGSGSGNAWVTGRNVEVDGGVDPAVAARSDC